MKRKEKEERGAVRKGTETSEYCEQKGKWKVKQKGHAVRS